MPGSAALPQGDLLERIAARAEATPEIVGLIVLGSLAFGTADEHSDLDLGLYVDEDALETFDLRAWLEAVAPVAALSQGPYAVNVLFRALVRAEIHFGTLARADEWATMAGLAAYPDLSSILLLDRTGTLAGRLRPLLAPPAARGPKDAEAELIDLIGHLLAADAARRRRLLAQSHAQLCAAHVPLLRLARLVEGNVHEWLAPERGLEPAISPEAYRRFAKTVVGLDERQLANGIARAWDWAIELAKATGADCLDRDTIRAIGCRLSGPEKSLVG